MAVYSLEVVELHPNRPDICRVIINPHPVTRARRQIGILHRDTGYFAMLSPTPVVLEGEERPVDTKLGPGHERVIRELVEEWKESNPWQD